MYEEAYQAIRDDERNGDSERAQLVQEMHDNNVPTTYERAQFNEDEEQAVYEMDDKLGAI